MIYTLMVITCLAFATDAIQLHNFNYNQYFPRNGFETFRQSRNNYDGFYGNQLPNPVCGRTLTKFDCPLFDFRSNVVSKYDFLNAISQKSLWFTIYAREIEVERSYGKCFLRYDSSSSNGDFVQEALCFDLTNNRCEDLFFIIRLEEDECGRVKLQGVNVTVEESIYSQDINQYFWMEICFGRVDVDRCQGGRYIELFVKGGRLVDEDKGRAADLTSLPWDLISADLKSVFGIEFSEMRYVFTGRDCDA